jgi:ribosomal protein S18 acetylase RimI-like enzyme
MSGSKETRIASRPDETGSPGLAFLLVGPEDGDLLGRIAPEVFDFAIDPASAAEFLNDPRHHLALALDGDTVVGMASAVDYVHPDKPRELFINEVGVAPTHRRLGVGRRLLEMLFASGRERGCREAWVGTEHENEAARALYKSLRGSEEPFILYSFRIDQ